MTAEEIRLKIKALIISALIRFAITFPLACIHVILHITEKTSFGRKSSGFKDYYFLF